MAGSTNNSIRNASPGDIVVPLSEIIQRLSSKISQSDIDALVTAILSRRTDIVRQGDLITSDLMNQILGDISNLQSRVIELEAGIGTSNQVIISRPLPGETFKVGAEMTVEGRNFGFLSGTLLLHIDDTLVTAFKSGSNDELLKFMVPELSPQVLPGGRSALLTVANDRSSAQRQIRVLSARDLEGDINVAFMSVDPANVPAGSTPRFRFNLHSRANYDAAFVVRPVVSGVTNPIDWNAGLSVLDPDTMRPVPANTVIVPEGGDTAVLIQLILPSAPDNTPFYLSVGADSGSVSGTSGPLRVVVGTGAEIPDPNTTLSFDAAAFDPADGGLFEHGTEIDTITVNDGALAQITLEAEFRAAGSYNALVDPVNEGPIHTANWNVRRHPQDQGNPFEITAEMLRAGGGVVSRSRRFLISPSTDPAHPASATGMVEFNMELADGSASRKLRMELLLG